MRNLWTLRILNLVFVASLAAASVLMDLNRELPGLSEERTAMILLVLLTYGPMVDLLWCVNARDRERYLATLPFILYGWFAPALLYVVPLLWNSLPAGAAAKTSFVAAAFGLPLLALALVVGALVRGAYRRKGGEDEPV